MLFSDDSILPCRRPDAPGSSESSMSPIPEALTVIITTSPTPSAPSTELLDTILASFHVHCPLLLDCNVVVVLDTYDRIAPVNRLKKGSITAEGAQNFAAYKDNVKRLVLKEFVGAGLLEQVLLLEDCDQAEYGSPCIATNFTALKIQRTEDRRVVFIEPSERLGFGLAVRSALRLVDTPYVWVQQHDWNLIVSIPIQSIVEVMVESDSSEDAPVKYVCLPSPRMLEYADSSHVKPFPSLRETTAALKRDFLVPSSPHKVPLTPLFFWHDKTHVASTKHYLNRVFPTRLAMARGAFIEDHIGQRARNQMKEGLFTKWACWLYYPDGGKLQCLRHLHGRTWRGREAEREKVEASKLQGGAPLSDVLSDIN